ncbi:MAG: exosortase-associated EpsI family protein [Planctomyces sp.]|nr:exosortase-associated EpsI family protein [Planctomyces sp.]
MTNRIAAVVVAVVAVAAFGIVYGRSADRWGPSIVVLEAADRLSRIPTVVEGWTSTPETISPGQLHGAGAAGYFARNYRDSAGNSVQISILCGRHGPISLHPPTVCFTNSGMKMLTKEETTKFEHAGVTSKFTTVDFLPPAEFSAPIRTFWAWSPDGKQWTNPKQPRMEFSGYPFLYKMYILTATEHAKEGAAPPTILPEVEQFVEDFLARIPDALRDTSAN